MGLTTANLRDALVTSAPDAAIERHHADVVGLLTRIARRPPYRAGDAFVSSRYFGYPVPEVQTPGKVVTLASDDYYAVGDIVRKRNRAAFYGDVTIEWTGEDDTELRDGATLRMVSARLTEEPAAVVALERRLLWRFALKAISPYLLHTTGYKSGGGSVPVTPPITPRLFVGTLAQPSDVIALTGLGDTETTLTLPTWTGNRYLYIAQQHDAQDLTGIYIGARGGLNLIDTFAVRRNIAVHESANYDAWQSGAPYMGSRASGLDIHVSR